MEIILIDDASQENFQEINRILECERVSYIQLKENIGRAKIRNLFLKYVKNEFLLFLDCDSQIINDDYLNNYRKHLNATTQLICGGSVYSEDCPSKKQSLRWKYGRIKESKPAKTRLLSPNKSFMTNNFLIKKQVLQETRFDERISKYGHEDTLLGIELEKKGVTIKHLENPVINIDIDTNEVFIRKTEDSLDNLLLIQKFYKDREKLAESIKLLGVVNKLKKYKLMWFFQLVYKVFKKQMKGYLINSQSPSLVLFNVYKICYYSTNRGK